MQSPAAEGPYFEDLTVGQQFTSAPGVTLSAGLAAVHQSITGNRLALTLDDQLCREVTGGPGLASPSLIWDIAIGQSTVVTRQVKANLFYRGLAFRRLPRYLDTLRTSTRVEALRQNRQRDGRWPTGLAVLHITTTDQDEQPVLDFWRCAMLPLRDPAAQTGRSDDIDAVGGPIRTEDLGELVRDWRLLTFAHQTSGPRVDELHPGQTWQVAGGDVVSGATDLARLTLNIAAVHHDRAAAGGERLVYGGHVIGLALAQLTRSLPSVVTVAGWHACEHLGPVREGDTLRSTVSVERVDLLPDAGGLVHLRSQVRADAAQPRAVLDWRYVVVLA